MKTGQLIYSLVVVVFFVSFFPMANRLKEKEALYDAKLEVYQELLDVTGSLAAMHSSDTGFQTKKSEFLTLYYGRTGLLSDDKVTKQLVALKELLETYDPESSYTFDMRLQYAVVCLAEACEKSL